jgi:hypothetical protein
MNGRQSIEAECEDPLEMSLPALRTAAEQALEADHPLRLAVSACAGAAEAWERIVQAAASTIGQPRVAAGLLRRDCSDTMAVAGCYRCGLSVPTWRHVRAAYAVERARQLEQAGYFLTRYPSVTPKPRGLSQPPCRNV